LFVTNHSIPKVIFVSESEAHFNGPFHSGRWIDEFKHQVPAGSRSYDPPTKTWTIFGDAYWCKVALGVFLQEFPHARIHRGDNYQADTPNDAYQTLYLLPGAPQPLVQAAYKVLARLNHPDVGGSTVAMQRINGAYAALQEAGAA
jgi:hypothetical protein